MYLRLKENNCIKNLKKQQLMLIVFAIWVVIAMFSVELFTALAKNLVRCTYVECGNIRYTGIILKQLVHMLFGFRVLVQKPFYLLIAIVILAAIALTKGSKQKLVKKNIFKYIRPDSFDGEAILSILSKKQE